MRDKGFVAVYRGGTLAKTEHQQLIRWARLCAEHVVPLLGKNIDERLLHALQIAKDWEQDKVSTGAAMKAARAAHAVARESTDPVRKAIARAIGHTVATAHMADHAMGAALYALVALKHAGKPLDNERAWQYKQLQSLPPEIVELVARTMRAKEKGFKIGLTMQ